jgi:hypothetical protein
VHGPVLPLLEELELEEEELELEEEEEEELELLEDAALLEELELALPLEALELLLEELAVPLLPEALEPPLLDVLEAIDEPPPDEAAELEAAAAKPPMPEDEPALGDELAGLDPPAAVAALDAATPPVLEAVDIAVPEVALAPPPQAAASAIEPRTTSARCGDIVIRPPLRSLSRRARDLPESEGPSGRGAPSPGRRLSLSCSRRARPEVGLRKRDGEHRSGRLAVRVEEIERVAMADRDADRAGNVVERHRLAHARVKTPKVDHEAPVHEDPEVVVAREPVGLAARVEDHRVRLEREIVVVRGALIAKEHTVDRKEGVVHELVRPHLARLRDERERQRRSFVDARHVVIPGPKARRARCGEGPGHGVACVDRCAVGAESHSDDAGIDAARAAARQEIGRSHANVSHGRQERR